MAIIKEMIINPWNETTFNNVILKQHVIINERPSVKIGHVHQSVFGNIS